MKSKLWVGLAAIFVITACKQQSNQESIYREFQIDSKCLSESRSVGIYLPAGYSEKNEYPVIYAEDGMVLVSGDYKHLIDSLIDNGYIKPIVVACSYENTNKIPGFDLAYRNAEYVESLSRDNDTLRPIFDNHMNYFINEFITMIEDNYSVSKSRENMIYYGTSNSADFGITLSMMHPELMANYWCFSPVASNCDGYPMLEQKIEYNICWGLKEELSSDDEYFQLLVQSIRKRGGKVYDWAYPGAHDRECWRDEFVKMLVDRFGNEQNIEE
jgi:enterochelin esterase-like enzyme